MNAGKLNHRVTLLQYTQTAEDEGFGAAYEWTEAATVWAQVMRPRITSGVAVGSGDAVTITQGLKIRPRDDVAKGWRVNLDGKLYKVLHVDVSVGREMILTLVGVEVDN